MRCAEADGVGDVAGAGLEAVGRPWNTVFSKVTSAIMLPPPCQGGIVLEDARLAVDDADAGRREHLVAGEHEEVAVERLHVDPHVRHRLRAVDDDDGAMPVRHGDHLADRRDGAERVRDLRERDERVRGSSSFSYSSRMIWPLSSTGATRSFAPFSAASCCQGTMLAWCSRCVMTISSSLLDVASAPGLGDEVDALGRAAHEDDLSGDGALMNVRTFARAPS